MLIFHASESTLVSTHYLMVIFHPFLVNKSLRNKTFQPVWFKFHIIISHKLYTDCIENCDHDPPAYSGETGGIYVLSRTMVNLTPLRD